MADQSKHLIDQRSGNSGAKTQPLLSVVEAAAQEFCKKILSVFQDNMPAGRTEQPQNQEFMLKCLNRLLWKVIEKLANFPPPRLLRKQWSSPSLLLPAELGIVEIIRTCLQYFPDLIFIETEIEIEIEANLLQAAIAKRRAKVFNLIKEMPTIALQLNLGMLESETTLHLAAKLAPSSQLLSVSGSALQMQRELQWFKVGPSI
ncbi:hypothetical protein EZV62_007304 [Acer yangbiense]|uniref:Uncharacterized protein n=1 Tax=Acer yangbiense TaxID=1000413 RepID=A0A5C7IBB3_9ROSI|nr:hypothetical protein EZV62_007304 [Acer yangbiense]